MSEWSDCARLAASAWLAAATLMAGSALAGEDSPAGEDGNVSLSQDTVLTERGPARVTLRELEAELARVPAEHRRRLADDPERLAKLLEKLAKEELLAQRAREEGLEEAPDVRARLERARQEVLAHAMLEHVRRTMEPADYEQQAREYYLTNPDEFRVPERVTVRHVLISTEDRGDEEARALAEEVAEAARGGERSFEELVEEYSEDPSASRNRGLFQDVERGDMVEPFEEAAFALEEPGDTAGPVESRYGYHVIRLEGRKEADKKPFEAVRDGLVARMEKRHRDRAVQEYVNELLASNPLQAEERVIRALRERYRIQGEGKGAAAGESQ